jgi:GxxExxY protein
MPVNNTVLSDYEERIAEAIVHSTFAVHKNLGPGLIEGIYETCLCHELTKRGLSWERQVRLPIIYDGLRFDEGLRLDLLVEGIAVCELKAVEHMLPVFLSQLLTYMKLSDKRLGFLINFNVPLIKNGLKRVVR